VGQVREACASESWQRPGAFRTTAADGRAIVTLFDIVDAGTIPAAGNAAGGNIHYRKPMTPRPRCPRASWRKTTGLFLDYSKPPHGRICCATP